jgi:hypothetical protein
VCLGCWRAVPLVRAAELGYKENEAAEVRGFWPRRASAASPARATCSRRRSAPSRPQTSRAEVTNTEVDDHVVLDAAYVAIQSDIASDPSAGRDDVEPGAFEIRAGQYARGDVEVIADSVRVAIVERDRPQCGTGASKIGMSHRRQLYLAQDGFATKRVESPTKHRTPARD